MSSLYVEQVNQVTSPQRVAVVVNPSKFSRPEVFTSAVSDAFSALGKNAPTFIETTIEDPGWGQTQQAMAAGADMVIAAGGDGTVRMVAGALAGSATELAIIPVGTGNLMARNLSVPLDDVRGAVTLALTGTRQSIDIGWLTMEPENGDRTTASGDSPQAVTGDADAADEHPFLVISGIGFDAQIMHATGSRLKKLMGVSAYFVAGAGRIIGRSVAVSVGLDNRSPKRLKARTVMIGNVGRLPGGFTLMPGADATNGSLEILALNWKGAVGFAQIATEMVAPGAPSLAQISSSRTFQARTVTVTSDRTMPVQVDGDVIGTGKRIRARVQPRALSVRVGKPRA